MGVRQGALGKAGITGPVAAAAPPAPWAPTDASIPILAWFRADLGVTEAGGLVSAWADQSGAGDANRDQAAAGGNEPSLTAENASYGDQPTIDGSGSKFFTSAGDWSTAPNPPITVVIVGHSAAGSAFLGAQDAVLSMMYVNGGGFESVYNGVGGARVGTGDPTVPCVFMYTDDGTGGGSAAKLYITDLGTPADTFATIWTGNTKLNLLRDFNGTFGKLNGSLAEVIVYGDVIGGADLADLVDYLNTTRAYGLGVT